MPAMPKSVRYARTEDRVNVAFTVLGEGEPIVFVPPIPWSNFSVMLSNPHTTRHPEELGSFARFICYDARGCGLSDHSAEDLSLEGFARDIDAVAGTLGIEQFTLYGNGDGSRVAIHYAATRPERVKRLVLWLPTVSADRLRDDQLLRVISGLAYRDWETFVGTLSHAVVGGWDAERAPYAAAFAELMRGGLRPEEFPRFALGMRDHDVQADMALVTAPTLVMTREQAAVYTVSLVREVAAGIPNAEFVCPPGNWLLPCTNDDVTGEIARFMGLPYTPAERHVRPISARGDDAMPRNGKLSAREWEVVELVALGKTNAEMADELGVSHATTSRHVHNILNKLGMSRRSEVAVYAALAGRARDSATR